MQFTRSPPDAAGCRSDDDRGTAAIGSAPASLARLDGREPGWLEDLFRLQSPWLNRFFRRRLGSANDAEDLTQETFARFLGARPAAAIETPEAYLRTIAGNLLRDRAAHSSTRWARVQVPLVEGLDCLDEVGPHRTLEAAQELEFYDRVLRQLPPRTLEVFLMSRLDGYRYAEIAGRLRISVWSVKREMMKAIAWIDQARRGG